jgi:hypothetical protein
MNSWSSPERIVIGNQFDQIDLLLWDLWSAASVPAFPSPIQLETLLMPSYNRFWLDDKQCAFPGAKEVCENAEKESIGRS